MRVVTLEDIVRGRARMGGGWLGERRREFEANRMPRAN